MNKKFTRIIFTSLIFSFFLAGLVFAETIVLKTGDKVQGNLIEKTGKYIKIEFAGVPMTYYLDEIYSINGKQINVKVEPELDNAINFKDTNSAIAYWKDKIQNNPKDFQALNSLGMLYASLNKFPEAIIYFEKSVALNPNYAQGFTNLGLAYNYLNQPEKAFGFLQRALEINPKSAETNNNLGRFYIDRQEFEKALTFCQKAAEINPKFADAYSNLGFIYVSLQKFDLGIDNLKKAVILNPKDATNYENLGYVFFLTGKSDQARDYFQKAKGFYAEKSDTESVERIEEFLKKLP